MKNETLAQAKGILEVAPGQPDDVKALLYAKAGALALIAQAEILEDIRLSLNPRFYADQQ